VSKTSGIRLCETGGAGVVPGRSQVPSRPGVAAPRRGPADYDLVIASQPYRARASAEFKASKVLARSREPGAGRAMIAIHSHGRTRGSRSCHACGREKIRSRPSPTLLKATRAALGADGRDLNFNAYADNARYSANEMHTLPEKSAMRSHLDLFFAAWNAAVYVRRSEDQRLGEVMGDRGYLETTQEVCVASGGCGSLTSLT